MDRVVVAPAGQTSRSPVSDASAGDVSLLQQVLQRLIAVDAKLDDVRDVLANHRKEQYAVEEFAELVGRSAYTIRRWIGEKKLSATRVSGTGPRGRLLVPRSELLRLVKEGKGGSVPDLALDGPSDPTR